MKILHVIGKRPTGGIGTVVKNYQSHLDITKCQFDYLIFNDEKNGDFDEYVKSYGSNVYVLPELRNSRLFLITREVKRFLEKNAKSYDAIHLHSPNIAFIVLRYAKKYDINIRIIHSHATEYSDKKLNAIRNYFLCIPGLYYATDYFYCSEAAKDFLFSKKTDHLFEMYNAIETEAFKFNKKTRDKVRKELQINENTLVLVHTGRFTKQKNHTYLIDVAISLNKRYSDFILLLIGDGPLKKEICEKIEYNHLNDKVLCLGYKKNISDYLACADIFLLPSLYEGLPLSVVEAQCNGLNIIISNNVTKELTFDKNKCTYLGIEKKDLKSWTNSILNFKNNDLKNREMAYLKADKKHYNINIEVDRVVNKYKNLIKSK